MAADCYHLYFFHKRPRVFLPTRTYIMFCNVRTFLVSKWFIIYVTINGKHTNRRFQLQNSEISVIRNNLIPPITGLLLQKYFVLRVTSAGTGSLLQIGAKSRRSISRPNFVRTHPCIHRFSCIYGNSKSLRLKLWPGSLLLHVHNMLKL